MGGYDNPNEHDDVAFTDASVELQGELPSLLDDLWKAGASKEDIEQEIAIALENMECGAFPNIRVEISGP